MTTIGKLPAFRQFLGKAWALSVPYFKSDERWRARGLLLAIIALNLGLVSQVRHFLNVSD